MAVRATSERLTAEEFLAFPDDGIRRELLDGEVLVTPSPLLRHQDIVLRLGRVIADHLDASGGGHVFIAPADVVLSKRDVVEPDVVFVGEDRPELLTEARIIGAPTLLVEVLSDPSRDRRRKRALYARSGVPEYWIVDPEGDRVDVYRLPQEGGTSYPKPQIFERGEALSTPHIPGLAIDLAWLLRR